jgi:transcription factor IIIB 90 kDa subunit
MTVEAIVAAAVLNLASEQNHEVAMVVTQEHNDDPSPLYENIRHESTTDTGTASTSTSTTSTTTTISRAPLKRPRIPRRPKPNNPQTKQRRTNAPSVSTTDTVVNSTTNTEEAGEQESTNGLFDVSSPNAHKISAEGDVNPNHTAKTSQAQPEQQNQQQQQQQTCCPNCASTAIELHDASGVTVCTECGVVVEENLIVSAIEFVEGAGGASNMVGQFVSATSSKAYTSSGGGGNHQLRGGGRYGFSRDSRETTLANGRRRIQELASRLRLSSHYVDGAHRLFTVAVERNFVQGRRTAHVVAACLYITCRLEKSQHMLIDFSDALQVNVYTLGTCFLKFRRLLGLKLEIIDPALYVYRFAAHLDLDDRANAVGITALRLVARMKRDWIVAGRRPAGICAAALLIAARAHGFDKQCADVTRILRVCGMTVTNRIREFERTPTAQLSLEQFQTMDFETEADPPIYTKNKIREARAKAIQEGNVELLASGALDDDGKRGSRWRAATKEKPASERTVKFQELYQSLDQKLNDDSGVEVPVARAGDSTLQPQADADNETTLEPQQQLVVHQNTNDAAEVDTPPAVLTQWKDAYPKSRGRDIIMSHEATLEEQLPSIVPTEAKLSLSDWKKSLPNEIDLEIEDFFRTSQEEKEKEAIFNKINKDYIAQQERKENERLDLEAATKDQELDDLAQAAGQARYKDVRLGGGKAKSKRHANRDSGGEFHQTTPSTTEEQLRAAVASRKVSRKINYDALSSIFDDDGSFATTTANFTDNEDNEGSNILDHNDSDELMF